jgi:hypothetical protein
MTRRAVMDWFYKRLYPVVWLELLGLALGDKLLGESLVEELSQADEVVK